MPFPKHHGHEMPAAHTTLCPHTRARARAFRRQHTVADGLRALSRLINSQRDDISRLFSLDPFSVPTAAETAERIPRHLGITCHRGLRMRRRIHANAPPTFIVLFLSSFLLPYFISKSPPASLLSFRFNALAIALNVFKRSNT